MKEFFVFDLDGTLALTHHRDHFIREKRKDWHKFLAACIDDQPNIPVIKIFQALKAQGYRLEIWSGRSDEVRQETEEWLQRFDIVPDKLQLRAHKDFTADHILKENWLKQAGSMPIAIFDDRNKVVNMWRHNHVTCFQVAEGDF